MSRRAKVVLGLAIAVGVMVVGQLLLPGSDSVDEAQPRPAPAPSEAGLADSQGADSQHVAGSRPEALSTEPSTMDPAAVAMGHTHDAPGARAAAVSYTRAFGVLVGSSIQEAIAIRRAMVADAKSDELVNVMLADLAPLRERWAVGEITYRVAPLATRVVMRSADIAQVEVWYVGVVAAAGVPTYDEWVTQRFTLVWERGDWRISAETESPGPRPSPAGDVPSTATELEARLAGFDAL